VEIAEGRVAFADALRHADANALGSIYAETARLVAPSAGVIEGRAAIQAFWQAGLDAGVVDVRLEAVEVQCRDSLAYEIGRYVLQLRPASGESVVDRGTYVLVLEQHTDGSWRRAVEMFSPEGPSAQAVEPSGR
jgi:ketosteroid isomerase-like protein